MANENEAPKVDDSAGAVEESTQVQAQETGAADDSATASQGAVHAEGEPGATEAAAASTGYHQTDDWKGLPHYECDNCSFDSLEEEAMKQHVVVHAPRLPMARPAQPATDKTGKE